MAAETDPTDTPASRPRADATSLRARAIAFYLPQFHPVPENDEWWGRGFTEWTNVAKAQPLFRGHRQPRRPADLGYYDLRVPEVRQAQADLATEYGIEAFCYWHYWFAGRQLLERPFQEVLTSGMPRLPFCLAWANQTWTGIWHGAAGRILIEQTYPGPEDERVHFEHLLPAFRDERYLRVDGKPLFYVFRPEQLPDPVAFVERWQQMAVSAGLGGLHLVAEVSDLLGRGPKYTQIREHGWDAGVYIRLPADTGRSAMLRMRLRRKLSGGPEVYPYRQEPFELPQDLRDSSYPCVYPNWDNSPRSGRGGLILEGSSPDRYARHLRHAADSVAQRDPEHRLLFVKSWNEWAEGNYLEPDDQVSRAWLEVTRQELQRSLRR